MTTSTTTLVEFLTGRLEEVAERAGRLAEEGRWSARRDDQALEWLIDTESFGTAISTGYVGNSDSESRATHIAYWDPHRVLAWCETMQWIIRRHGSAADCDDCLSYIPCSLLRRLALLFADHSDYQESWRP